MKLLHLTIFGLVVIILLVHQSNGFPRFDLTHLESEYLQPEINPFIKDTGINIRKKRAKRPKRPSPSGKKAWTPDVPHPCNRPPGQCPWVHGG